MTVQHNISAFNANRQLNIVQKTGSKSAEKLSSGYRINRAADDAAGLSISEKMRKQIRGLTKAGENVEDGISLCQVADGAMAEMHDMTNRMNELCVQAANGTNSADDRAYIQMEIDSIVEEFGRIINTTKFNEVYIFKGDEDFRASAGSEIEYASSSGGIGGVDGITAYPGNKLTDRVTFGPDWIENSPNALSTGEYLNCAWIDFTDFTANTKSEFISKLQGEGFDWSCCSCGSHASIRFVSGLSANAEESAGGISHESVSFSNNDALVKIDLNSIWDKYQNGSSSLGEVICESLIDVISYVKDSASNPIGCFNTSCAYKQGTGKLYIIYNNQFYYPDGGDSTFSTIPRNDAGVLEYEYKPVRPQIGQITTQQLAIHAGSDADGTNKVIMKMPTFTNKNLKINSVSVLTEDLATNSIDVLTDIMQLLSANRSRIGAYQNRLEHTSLNLDNIVENTTDSESKIRDTDMADEMVRYSNNSILTQVGQSMLSQANSSKQNILSLLSA
ncbi:MAG: flagellin [Lachnospiraceae bacterium]|nr:flagellin [Lachnospiraceae bacterium]